MKHMLIDLADTQQWESVLATMPHSCFHTLNFCQAMQLAQQQNIKLYVGEDVDKATKIICPLVIRKYQQYYDVCNPYGYSGFCGDINQEWLISWSRFMAEQNYTCGYVLSHPCFSACSFDFSHTAYIIDLKQPLDQIYQQWSTNHRRNLKKFNNNITIITDKNILIPAFLELYTDFLKRIQASSIYNFNSKSLKYIFSRSECFLVGIKQNNKITAVSAFLHNNYGSEFFLNAASLDGKVYARQLIWEGIQYCKNLNIPFLNLGGGIKDNDGLANFKRQFGAEEVNVYAAKLVFQQDDYQHACESTDIPSDNNTYFPPYRQVNKN